MPAEVVLVVGGSIPVQPAAVVSLDPLVDCAFVLVSDSWFGGTAAARSLAFRDISEGCDISSVAALTLSPFGGLGPLLKPWPPWPLAAILKRISCACFYVFSMCHLF
jgi:hypothetical protein